MAHPLILLSNDDGIEAPGLQTLADALAPLGDLWVCAPDGERSAASHAVSLQGAWRVDERGPQRFAIDGTPADCVYIGATQLLPRFPDVVVSGINNGINIGSDVIYSGTVAAAAEGAMLDRPGIAVSTEAGASVESYARAARFGAALATWVLETGWRPQGCVLNVNVPDTGAGEDRFALGAMGVRRYELPERPTGSPLDADGLLHLVRPYTPGTAGATGEDAEILRQGLICVTPLRLDLTARDQLDQGRTMRLPGFESTSAASEVAGSQSREGEGRADG